MGTAVITIGIHQYAAIRLFTRCFTGKAFTAQECLSLPTCRLKRRLSVFQKPTGNNFTAEKMLHRLWNSQWKRFTASGFSLKPFPMFRMRSFRWANSESPAIREVRNAKPHNFVDFEQNQDRIYANFSRTHLATWVAVLFRSDRPAFNGGWFRQSWPSVAISGVNNSGLLWTN